MWIVPRVSLSIIHNTTKLEICSLTDLVVLHLTSLNRCTAERALNGGVDLLDVVLQLCPGDGLVTLDTEGDVPGAVEGVHHVTLLGDVPPATMATDN